MSNTKPPSTLEALLFVCTHTNKRTADAFFAGFMNNDPPPDGPDESSRAAVRAAYRVGCWLRATSEGAP
jgi:hypothetical protein